MAITPEQEAAARALLAKGDKLGQAASQQTGVAYNPQYTTYQPEPIAASNLSTNQQPAVVPQYQEPPIQSLEQMVADNNQPSSEVTAAKEAQNATLANIEALLGKQGTEAQRKGELETAAGIPDMQKNLNNILAQINAINASAFNATINAENRLAPTFAIYGEQAQIERQKSAQTFGLAAAANAMQNNIALANTNIQRALDTEFGAIESQLAFQKLVLDLNRDDLSKAEQKQAQLFQLKLQERERQLTEMRTQREGIYNLMMTLGQNGVDPSIIQQLSTATSFEHAIRMAAPYMQSPEAKIALEEAKLNLQYKKNQLILQGQQISQGNTNTQQIGNDVISVLGSNKIGQTTKTSVGTILGVINAAEDLAKTSKGVFTGFYPGAKLVDVFLPNALKKDTTVRNEAYLNAINLKVQQWASGATLTEQQTKLVYGMVPTKNDNDAKVREKLNNLINFMQQQIKGSLASEGVYYQPAPVDLFHTDTLDDIFSTPNWNQLKMQ